MRVELRAISGAAPRCQSVASASANLERAWDHLCQAHDRFAMSTPGETDRLFQLRDEWIRAIDVYELARVRHAVAVKQANGSAWLWSVSP